MKLFSEQINTFEEINLKDAKLFYCENFWVKEEADSILKVLQEELQWEQGSIKIFGKNILEPRLTAWYGDAGKAYTYSGVKREPLAWHPILKKIKSDIEVSLASTINLPLELNSVLCNYYRDRNDSMGYHADNDGSVLIMAGEMQHHWLHAIPKSTQILKPRINLTFRNIKN